MLCPRCRHDNPTGSKFCLGCGARLGLTCASCGVDLPVGSRFCNNCGGRVSADAAPQPQYATPEAYTPLYLADKILRSKGALEGERKQVTVLFADLKGSLELLADRDPEEARRLLDPVLERMMEAVHHYEGTVNQVMGDGIMALFGAPVAHEDHAVRACFAALRMQRRINLYADELQRGGSAPVQIRVGLNSGEVVVRSIGSDLRMDYTAVGQTTHLAARMEQMAKPGSILVTGDALKLAEGYVRVRPLGPVSVKGLESSQQVYEVTGIGTARSRLQASAARGLSRFVGRASEMQQLALALDRGAAGHGQTVAIVGEAGVGKSRLIWEFARSHRTYGWLVLESSSVSYGKATPYLPVRELLKAYLRIQERDDQREIRERVAGRLLLLDRALEPLLVPLLALLDLPVEDAAWEALDPRERRQRILEAVKRLLLWETQVQPLLVIFEDLHWIDSETQALLDGLVESLPTARILLLVNYRPEYQHTWGHKTYYLQMRIDPLPPASADELLSALLGRDLALEPLKRLLIARTDGNPFFLEESVQTLVETQVLVGERGAYRLARAPESLLIPATAQAVLAARIDRLPPEDKHLLQSAAAIGKHVPFALLHAIADLDEDALRQQLSRLQAAEFLYEASLFPDLEYRFKHALTHEVAYGSLVHERRRQLHARISTAIEQRYHDRLGEHLERLAHHAVHAGLTEKAVQYSREAGVKAVARSAFREAVDLLQQASRLLDELPETGHMLTEDLSIRMALGPALMATRGAGAAEVEACYRRAQQLCERLGDHSRLFPVLWGLWYVHHSRGDYARARELAEQVLRVAKIAGDPAFLLEANHAMWSTSVAMGRPAEAAEYLEQGLALDEPGQRRSWWLYGTHDPRVCCRHMLAIACWLRGYPEQALKWAVEQVRLAVELDHAFTTMMALYGAAWVHYHRGDTEAATERAQAAVALGRARGFSVWPEHAEILLARLKVDQGLVKDGVAQAEEAFSRGTAPGWTWAAVVSSALLAGAYAKAGQPDKGLCIIGTLAARDVEGFYEPELRRLHGELLRTSAPDARAAESCFRRAIELARTRQEQSLELRAVMSLCRLLRTDGRRDEARELLARTHARFVEGLDTADLREARALGEELS